MLLRFSVVFTYTLCNSLAHHRSRSPISNPVLRKYNYLVSGFTHGPLCTAHLTILFSVLSREESFHPQAPYNCGITDFPSLTPFSSTLNSQSKYTDTFLISCHQIYKLALVGTHHVSPSHLWQKKLSPSEVIPPPTPISGFNLSVL